MTGRLGHWPPCPQYTSLSTRLGRHTWYLLPPMDCGVSNGPMTTSLLCSTDLLGAYISISFYSIMPLSCLSCHSPVAFETSIRCSVWPSCFTSRV
jgi:hypothetical protein